MKDPPDGCYIHFRKLKIINNKRNRNTKTWNIQLILYTNKILWSCLLSETRKEGRGYTTNEMLPKTINHIHKRSCWKKGICHQTNKSLLLVRVKRIAIKWRLAEIRNLIKVTVRKIDILPYKVTFQFISYKRVFFSAANTFNCIHDFPNDKR